jgi:hypothetical protein
MAFFIPLAGAAAGAAIASSVVVGVVVGAAVGYAINEVIDYVTEQAIEDAIVDTMQKRSTTARDPLASRKVVYGKCRVGGSVVYLANSGDDNEYLHQITVFAGHEIESFNDIYYDDIKAGGYIGTGSVSNSNKRYYNRYSSNDDGSESEDGNYTLFSCRNGTDDQSAYDTSNVSPANKRLPAQWSSNHRLRGHAHVYTRFTGTEGNPYTKVPNVTATITGKKIYNPQYDSTSSLHDGGTGDEASHRQDDPSTWAYSNNAALVVLDFLTDSEFGAAIPYNKIDLDSLDASIDVCNQNISVNGTTVKRYSCNGQIDMQTSIRNNLVILLSSMNGRVTFSGGKFHVDAYHYKTPHAIVLDEDMLVGNLQIKTKSSRKDLYNTVKGSFMSQQDNYKPAQFPTQKSQTYIDADKEILEHDMRLSMTTDDNQAQILASLTMLKSRMQTTLKATLNIEGLQYRVGDNVKVANEAFGYTQADPKIFEITRLSVKPDTEKGIIVSIDARENAEAIYNYDASTALTYTSGTTAQLYDPYEITPVTSCISFPAYTASRNEWGVMLPFVGQTLNWEGSTGDYLKKYETVLEDANGTHVITQPSGKNNYTTFTELLPNRTYKATIKAYNINNVRATPDFVHTFTTNDVSALGTGSHFHLTSDAIGAPSDVNFLDHFGKNAVKGDQIVLLQVDALNNVLDSATYVYRPEISINRVPISSMNQPDGSYTSPETYVRHQVDSADPHYNLGFETQVINEDVTWTIQSVSGFACSDPSITGFTNLTITELADTDDANTALLNCTCTHAQADAREHATFGGTISYYEMGTVTVRATWDAQYVEMTQMVGVIVAGYTS